jgi:hypothetical protein
MSASSTYNLNNLKVTRGSRVKNTPRRLLTAAAFYFGYQVCYGLKKKSNIFYEKRMFLFVYEVLNILLDKQVEIA